MTYKLAKQLKEAGFPQGEPNSWSVQFADRPKDEIKGNPLEDYIPTLNDLIKSLGDKLLRLENLNNGEWTCQTSDRRFAEPTNLGDIIVWGKTPSEAVAKLYIKIYG